MKRTVSLVYWSVHVNWKNLCFTNYYLLETFVFFSDRALFGFQHRASTPTSWRIWSANPSTPCLTSKFARCLIICKKRNGVVFMRRLTQIDLLIWWLSSFLLSRFQLRTTKFMFVFLIFIILAHEPETLSWLPQGCKFLFAAGLTNTELLLELLHFIRWTT